MSDLPRSLTYFIDVINEHGFAGYTQSVNTIGSFCANAEQREDRGMMVALRQLLVSLDLAYPELHEKYLVEQQELQKLRDQVRRKNRENYKAEVDEFTSRRRKKE